MGSSAEDKAGVKRQGELSPSYDSTVKNKRIAYSSSRSAAEGSSKSCTGIKIGDNSLSGLLKATNEETKNKGNAETVSSNEVNVGHKEDTASGDETMTRSQMIYLSPKELEDVIVKSVVTELKAGVPNGMHDQMVRQLQERISRLEKERILMQKQISGMSIVIKAFIRESMAAGKRFVVPRMMTRTVGIQFNTEALLATSSTKNGPNSSLPLACTAASASQLPEKPTITPIPSFKTAAKADNSAIPRSLLRTNQIAPPVQNQVPTCLPSAPATGPAVQSRSYFPKSGALYESASIEKNEPVQPVSPVLKSPEIIDLTNDATEAEVARNRLTSSLLRKYRRIRPLRVVPVNETGSGSPTLNQTSSQDHATSPGTSGMSSASIHLISPTSSQSPSGNSASPVATNVATNTEGLANHTLTVLPSQMTRVIATRGVARPIQAVIIHNGSNSSSAIFFNRDVTVSHQVTPMRNVIIQPVPGKSDQTVVQSATVQPIVAHEHPSPTTATSLSNTLLRYSSASSNGVPAPTMGQSSKMSPVISAVNKVNTFVITTAKQPATTQPDLSTATTPTSSTELPRSSTTVTAPALGQSTQRPSVNTDSTELHSTTHAFVPMNDKSLGDKTLRDAAMQTRVPQGQNITGIQERAENASKKYAGATTRTSEKPTPSSSTSAYAVPAHASKAPPPKTNCRPLGHLFPSTPPPILPNPEVTSGTSTTPILPNPEVTPIPIVEAFKKNGAICLRVDIPQDTNHADIRAFQVKAQQVNASANKSPPWEVVGSCKPVLFPMCITLSKSGTGTTYNFRVRAMDVYGRIGPYSKTCTITS